MGWERVDLAAQTGVDRQRRWRSGRLNGWDEQFVTVGRLADGRWFAHHTGKRGGAWVFHTERRMCDVADRWLGDGRRWLLVPAVFNARGEPADGRVWHRSGQAWLPGPPPG